MSERETHILVQVLEQLALLREDITSLSEKLSALYNLRTANGRLYETQFDAFQKRCDERFETVMARMKEAEGKLAKNSSQLNKISGGWAAVLAIVAIVSAIINIVLSFV